MPKNICHLCTFSIVFLLLCCVQIVVPLGKTVQTFLTFHYRFKDISSRLNVVWVTGLSGHSVSCHIPSPKQLTNLAVSVMVVVKRRNRPELWMTASAQEVDEECGAFVC